MIPSPQIEQEPLDITLVVVLMGVTMVATIVAWLLREERLEAEAAAALLGGDQAIDVT
jgi:hypothetical protein